MSEAENSPKTKRMVPLKEGAFRMPKQPGGKPVLPASRCPSCGAYFFPQRHICLACGHDGLEDAELSDRGKIWTYTIARQTPPGSLIEAPYAVVVAEFPEKVSVETVLTDCDLDSVHVGMEVELVLAKMTEDEEGNDVMSYKFKPVRD